MGIVSVPTPVWNELMKIPLKDLKGDYNSIPYYKEFPKGTDLRKVSKKDKLQRYWCGRIKRQVDWYKSTSIGITNDLLKINREKYYKNQKQLTLKDVRQDFTRKARIFHKICIEGDIEDGHTFVQPMPHLWGNFQATDLSIVICMMLLKEEHGIANDKLCLGGDDREIFCSIRNYEKRNKIDYHIEKK
jgi:hypothetical protein